MPRRSAVRAAVASLAAAAVLVPLGWLWFGSRLPDSYSAAAMGAVDHGGGPGAGHGAHGGRPVPDLTADPSRPADVRHTLVARQERYRLATGEPVTGYTLNGTSPGPTLRAALGQLVEVVLVNESVPAGTTLHWHGLPVPNAADGVAGVTQDAVPVGGRHVYRFVANRAGTFWYHAHQVSHTQVRGGLLGALVITTAAALPREELAVVHSYAGRRTVGGRTGDTPRPARAGERVRVRVVNTDDGLMRTWVTGAPYLVRAVDGVDLSGPAPVTGAAVALTAGARADLEVVVPAGGARVEFGGSAALVLAPPGVPGPAPSRAPGVDVDLLRYGSPAPTGLDPAAATRRFDYVVGRRPGFLDGVPGIWWTVNGRMLPDTPMYVVREGDTVLMRIRNDTSESHPMHLHGHHALVLSRDGRRATGSPWWVDSLEVAAGEAYEVVFRADNPGLWMDHCHNLPHAAEGMVAHLMYEGVSTPYRLGRATGNEPE